RRRRPCGRGSCRRCLWRARADDQDDGGREDGHRPWFLPHSFLLFQRIRWHCPVSVTTGKPCCPIRMLIGLATTRRRAPVARSPPLGERASPGAEDRKSTRLNSSHVSIS